MSSKATFLSILSMCLILLLASGCGGSADDTTDADAGDNLMEDPDEDAAVDMESDPDAAPDIIPDPAPDTSPDPDDDPVDDGGGEPELPGRCPVVGDLGPGDHEFELTHDGITHNCLLHVPAVYDNSVETPLVLNMHGLVLNARNQEGFSNMNPVADARGFIVAYPDGYQSSWNAGGCCGQASSENIDDVGYLKAVVAHLTERLCIDQRRVYATGLSNGGHMSNRLGCEAGDVFAAIAPVAGAVHVPDCSPARPIPVIIYHGKDDWIVFYSEGRSAFEEWIGINGCTGEPVRTEYGGSYCEAYEACAAGVKTTMCTLDPMGHCWPGGSQSHCLFAFGSYNDDIIASEHMVDFFMEFTLP
ncbi:MAG: PHB depolymerase family esterase [Pseudomonadota bacterium]